MGKPWAYLGEDGKWYLTPGAREQCLSYREKSRISWNNHVKECERKRKEEDLKNDPHSPSNPATS